MRLALTARGGGLVCGGVLLLAAAWLGRVPDLRWPGWFLVALPLVSVLIVLAGPRVRFRREVRPPVVPVLGRVAVWHEARVEREGLGVDHVVEEVLPAVLGGRQRYALRAGRAGSDAHAWYERQPRRRGRWPLGAVWLESSDPLGLAVRRRPLKDAASLVVTPLVLPLDSDGVSPSGMLGDTPLPQSSTAGPDDVAVREYRPRDDVRRVHWPATARLGELMVRREELAWDPTAWVILDDRAEVHPLTGDVSPSFEWVVSVAASVGVRLLADGFDVSLATTGGTTVSSHNVGGEQAGQAWVEHLVDAERVPSGSLAAAVRPSTGTPGGVLVAVLGRLDADAAAALVSAETRHACRAIVPPVPTAPQAADEHRKARRMLDAHGWNVAEVAAGGDLASVWRHSLPGVRA